MATDSFFGLYTSEGDALAERLVSAICDDVEADRLTRRQALDRAADAMERIAAIDGGMADPDPARAIAGRLSASFSLAGFLPVDGEGLRAHFDGWRRCGAPVEQEALPAPVALLGGAVHALSAAMSALPAHGGLSVAIAGRDPLADGFEDDPASKAEIALFAYQGDVSRNPYVGCVLTGPDGRVPVEALAGHPDPAPLLRSALPIRDGVDRDALVADLLQIAAALDAVNLAASLVNEPDRLSFSIGPGEGGPTVAPLWDGEPLAAALAGDGVSPLLSEAAPLDEALLPDILREGPGLAAETFVAAEPPAPHPAPMP